MAESYVQVNKNATSGAKLKTFESTDGGGNQVASEAVTLVDAAGTEIVASLDAPGSLAPTTPEVTVTSASPALVLAENLQRKSAVLQNTGSSNVRVGPANVTATSGVRLLPNGTLTIAAPFIPTDAWYAIAESGSSTVSPLEIV